MRCPFRNAIRLVVFAAGVELALGVPGTAIAAAADERPNIVLIVTDDLNHRLVDYLPRLREMLPAQGLELGLTITTPVCAPSRATILTGQYAHNHGALVNGMKRFRALGRERETFGVWLDDAGYTTGFFGKYLNEYERRGEHVPPGWDRWVAIGRWSNRRDFGIVEDGHRSRRVRGVYDVDFFARELATFVREAKEPFVAVWTPMSPHGPFKAAPRHRGRYASVEPSWPPSFDADPERVAALTRTRLDMMLAVEEGTAQTLEALSERGVLDRTYVFFTSDNGLFAGEHGFPAGKGQPFEETTRVPLYVRGPGVPVARSDVLVGNHDLAPTILDLAGLAVPEQVDGRSFAPILRGATPRGWRNGILLEFWRIAAGETWHAARAAETKYVRWPDGRCEVFDLRRDPYEMAGAACGEAAGAIVARLQQLGRCRGVECAWLEETSWPPDPAAVAAHAADAACRLPAPWLEREHRVTAPGRGL